MAKATRNDGRTRRHARVREKVRGSAARPRLAVFRSLTHIYAQLVDDDAGKTLAAASSLDTKDAKGKRTELAKSVGTLLGDRAKQKGVTEVVFDRGGYRYHGRVKALADGVRAAGVKV
ncbi:MAG: 50S ribosomal protein L18 [Chloroflexi bacterium]|nr:MAG: 50S ribosomal protein L18 [Chloroflexota bacterium]TMF54828.1 MAG: 50S ribosomal protein L18 [Chloroflexota bacterium]